MSRSSCELFVIALPFLTTLADILQKQVLGMYDFLQFRNIYLLFFINAMLISITETRP